METDLILVSLNNDQISKAKDAYLLRRPDYQITEKELLAAWVLFANQLLKYGYAMADL